MNVSSSSVDTAGARSAGILRPAHGDRDDRCDDQRWAAPPCGSAQSAGGRPRRRRVRRTGLTRIPRLMPIPGLLLGLLVTALATTPGRACPFCTASALTISEEMEGMDVVALARLTRLPDGADSRNAGQGAAKGEFRVVEVLKGSGALEIDAAIRAIVFGQEQLGDQFLVMGTGAPDVAWSSPMKVSDVAGAYIRRLGELPTAGIDRLAFFQDYLESPEALISRDAYNEFAKAPYTELVGLRDKMDHGRLVAWIQNPDTPINRKRLYLVMLSVCGGPEDLPMLEQLLCNEDRQVRGGLDALVASYLMLAGESGMTLVEDLFLKNAQAEYADTYAAIMALRFLGTETQAVPRERLLQGLHALVGRPELADLIIPDLVRWEDWSQIERLVALFKDADEKANFIRAPVINYVRACPKPEAKQYLAELAKIDPEAFKRAAAFFVYGAADTASAAATTLAATPARLSAAAAEDTEPADAAGQPVAAEPADAANVPAAAAEDDASSTDKPANAPRAADRKLPVLHRTNGGHVNFLTYLVVFWVVGGVFFVAQWAVLAGVGRGD